jgi:hypothetical protein
VERPAILPAFCFAGESGSWRPPSQLGILVLNEDPDIEESPLSGIVTRDGVVVRVEIYRLVEGDESWTLEVINHEGRSTVWEDRFATDKEAYAEFYQTLETDGIRSFSEEQPESTKH